jgi:murein L,D-transpeptidase YafK
MWQSISRRRRPLLFGLACLLAACARTPAPVDEASFPQQIIKPQIIRPNRSNPWVLVDTRRDTVSIMNGDRPVEVFYNIAIGSGGAGFKRWRGDEVTPRGVFRIGWINWHSRFKTFFGLDYPNREYADQAYREGRISDLDYSSIRYALDMGTTPPQDTPLGGSVGIHGVGAGDPSIHASYNWTSGCVALDNAQIDRFAQWVNIGTTVEIR